MSMPAADTRQPATITGRRPSRSASRPPGSRVAAFRTATTPNPMPVQTADRCSTSRTNSGTIAARTPNAANPSARLAPAAARYARSRSARAISPKPRAAGGGAPLRRRDPSRSTATAMAAGTTSRQP